ncbi:MAG: hypothetical protein NVSMB4_08920 [Acidimicrobiales bacterium]
MAVEEAEALPPSPRNGSQVGRPHWRELGSRPVPWAPVNRVVDPVVLRARKLGRSVQRPSVVLGAMVAAYVAVFGSLTWSQQSNFGTFGFDMGIFDQEIWLVSRFKPPFITVRGLDMWANHVNPIVYLLAPAYWLGAGPHFLYFLQTAALAAGAVPLWLIARDRFRDGWLALAIPLAWLLYPSLQWMTWWHFHPESLAVPPLLFAWWFAGRGKWPWYALCLCLVLATKEDAGIAVAAMGAVIALRGNRVVGAWTVAGAVAWVGICLKVVIPHATGAANPFYADQYAELGRGTNSIIVNAVRHPSRVIHLALRRDRHDYYVKMFAPVAGLCVLAPVVLLLVLPTLVVNVVNNQGYPHDYRFQYQVFVSCGVFLALIEGLSRVRRPGMNRFLVGAVCASSLAATAVWGPSPLNARVYHSGIWALHGSTHLREMDRAVHLVPPGASITASYPVVPHLTHRTKVYEWPNPYVRSYYGLDATTPMPNPGTVQYLLLDTGVNPDYQSLADDLTGPRGEFRVIVKGSGVLLARRFRPPGAAGRD